MKFNGVEIGKVTSIELTPERRITLTMKIREEFHDIVRQGSVAKVNHLAILGDIAIEITRGDPQLPRLEDGATIPVKETPALGALLSRLAPAVDDVVATADHARAVVEAVDPQAVTQITNDLRVAVAGVREILEQINSGKGTIGRLFNDEQLAADITAAIANLDDVLKQAEARLREIQPLIDNVTAGTEEMDALLDEATRLLNELGVAVDSFTSSHGGAIGGLLLEARSALDEAEKTLRAIRNTWPFSGNAPEEAPVEAVPPQPPAD
ncbi:MAG TPA: MlaD family protein [Gammaproteobacteria bacterium]